MFNTVGELLDYTRILLFDPVVNSNDSKALWSNADLIQYINAAQKEFSILTRSIYNASDYTISAVAGTATYSVSDKIISIEDAYSTTYKNRVNPVSREEMDNAYVRNSFDVKRDGDWQTETGIPQNMVLNLEHNEVRLYPIPRSTSTIQLYVIKVADDVTNASDTFEIDSQFIHGLTFRIMSFAYNKQDAETSDAQKSMIFAQKWASFIKDTIPYYDNKFHRGAGNVINR